MKYIVTLNDFKQIVTESVKRILSERMNIIDKKMFPLAEYIFNKVLSNFSKQNYVIKFTLPISFIKNYYPYKNPQDLNISAEFDNTNGIMEYSKNKTILINLSKIFNNDENIIISNILHELTHYVNDCEGNIKDIYKTNDNTLNNLLYLLRDSECNARCSAFGYLLSKETVKKQFNEYEEITKFNKINKLLTRFKLSNSNKKTIKHFLNKFEKYKQKLFKIYYTI